MIVPWRKQHHSCMGVVCPLHTWIVSRTCHKRGWNSVSFSTSACRLPKEVEVWVLHHQFVENSRTWVGGTLLPELLPCYSVPLCGLIDPDLYQCVFSLGPWLVGQAAERSSVHNTGSWGPPSLLGQDCSLLLTLAEVLEPWSSLWETFSLDRGKGGGPLPTDLKKWVLLLIIWIYIAIAGFAWLYDCAPSCLIKIWECKWVVEIHLFKSSRGGNV